MAPTAASVVLDPTVTVIVPTFDRPDLLAVALRSVQLQNFAKLECIVIDDGQNPATTAAALAFTAMDQRFRLLKHRLSLGASAARNTGLAAASAPYVCFLDDDDFLLENSIQSRLDTINQHDRPLLAGSYCGWINTDPDVNLEVFTTGTSAWYPDRPSTIHFGSLLNGVPFIVTSPLIRTDYLRQIGGFDEALDRAEDADLWGRLLRLGFEVDYSRSLGVTYRRTPIAVVTASPEEQLRRLDMVFHRLRQDRPEIAGAGPLPSTDGLAVIAAKRSMLDQYAKYLALVAVTDRHRAVDLAEQLLPAELRRVPYPEFEVGRLVKHVRARLRLPASETPTIESTLREFLTEIEPTPHGNWQPLAPLDASVVGHRYDEL